MEGRTCPQIKVPNLAALDRFDIRRSGPISEIVGQWHGYIAAAVNDPFWC